MKMLAKARTALPQLLADAGFRVVKSEVIQQVEPDGGEIAPMWFVAQRLATP